MKVALLVPQYVSAGVIDLAEAMRAAVGIDHVVSFKVPGPFHSRISDLLTEWHFRPLGPRVLALRRYAATGRPQSPVAGRSAVHYAGTIGVPCSLAPAMNAPQMVQAIENSACDVIVPIGAGIVGAALLRIPGKTFLNAHPGRLPELPGRDTGEWAVYLGQPVYGTVHKMTPRIDAGEIVVQEPLEIGRPKTIVEFHRAVGAATWQLGVRALQGLSACKLGFVPQDLSRRRHMYYRMHPELLRVVSRRLEDGSFFRLQEQSLAEFRRGRPS
jgi:hypothetical protein